MDFWSILGQNNTNESLKNNYIWRNNYFIFLMFTIDKTFSHTFSGEIPLTIMCICKSCKLWKMNRYFSTIKELYLKIYFLLMSITTEMKMNKKIIQIWQKNVWQFQGLFYNLHILSKWIGIAPIIIFLHTRVKNCKCRWFWMCSFLFTESLIVVFQTSWIWSNENPHVVNPKNRYAISIHDQIK